MKAMNLIQIKEEATLTCKHILQDIFSILILFRRRFKSKRDHVKAKDCTLKELQGTKCEN